ncbi:hypothetical protein AB0C84_36255, partial [Actinomadura sp. NPDC048955]|uniref:hypothetical protein n=1 Tax=Actinomadura sp. NPDC048955 TaxID=3158228 RepID=UPI0033C38169
RGQAQPPVLGIAPQQNLRDGHADQLGIAQQPGTTPPPLSPGRQDVIVQMNIECGQKGVQVSLHTPTMGALRRARTQFNDSPSTI